MNGERTVKLVNCYNCGEDKGSFYAEENGFSLVKCDGCGLLYIESRPTDSEISQAHKQGKHSGDQELNMTGSFDGGRIPKYLTVLKDLLGEAQLGDTTWLDIGCGHGEFMVAVQQFSSGTVEIRGTDPNVNKQRSAQKRGLDVSYIDLETHDTEYDFISLLNVYSHLPDPPEFLESLKRLLKPQGQLILETGDTADLPAKDHPRPFYLPDHLSFGSERILVDILERLDFDVQAIERYPYLQTNFNRVAREFVKAISPKHQSRFQYYFKGIPNTDMFIRAKLKA